MSKNEGMKGQQFWLLSVLGYIALQEGKWDEARRSFVKDLRRFRLAGQTSGMLSRVEGLAQLAARQGQPDRAVRLFAFAAAMRKAKDDLLVPAHQALVDRDLALAITQVDDKIFEALCAEGSAMTLEQAVAYALGETNEPIS